MISNRSIQRKTSFLSTHPALSAESPRHTAPCNPRTRSFAQKHSIRDPAFLKPDRGLNVFVQTIECADCKALYDVVTRLRVPDESKGMKFSFGLNGLRSSLQQRNSVPPSFQSALNRLPYRGVRHYKWLNFKPQCPVSPIHRVQNWSETDKCPRCGLHLDKNALPFRIWE